MPDTKIKTKRTQYDRDCKITYKVPSPKGQGKELKKILTIGKCITETATIDQVNAVCEAVASIIAYPIIEKFDVPKFDIERV